MQVEGIHFCAPIEFEIIVTGPICRKAVKYRYSGSETEFQDNRDSFGGYTLMRTPREYFAFVMKSDDISRFACANSWP